MTGRRELWSRCYLTARTEGIAAGFALLSGAFGAGEAPCGPGGHLVVPARATPGGGTARRRAAVAEGMLAAEGLAVVRRPGPDPGTAGDKFREWLTGLAWLRLGTSERLLGSCLGYLGGRSTGGSPLIGQQMVKGDVSDAVIEQMEVRAVLSGAAGILLTAAELGHLHRQLTGADRMLLRLLGASGFLADGPGRQALVSELLADVYRAAADPAAADPAADPAAAGTAGGERRD